MIAVVTGGAGFLGGRLVDELRARGATEVRVLDVATGGSLDDHDAVARAVARADRVFHLAAMVSAESELDPERAWNVNVEGTRTLIRTCAEHASGVRFVFASTAATLAAEDSPVSDDTRARPRSTYGMTKAIGELLVAEASRRGQIDGRSARLPTVVVRPGRPNRAASSFASGLFREPLAGVPSVVPVAEATPVVLIGADTAVRCLADLAEVPPAALGHERAVALPGLVASVGEMIAASRAAAERHAIAAGAITVERDEPIERIVASWPTAWDDRRGRALGLRGDESLDAIVDAHVAATR